MKTYKNIGVTLLILFATFTTACNSPIESSTNPGTDDMLETLATMPKEDLSSTEEDGLAFMREEEKLARDVYIAMYEKWDLVIFDNISKAEQKHMDALKMLLDRYSMEDPIKNDELGVFENEELQALYDGLIETGNKSLVDALVVGQSIEEIDILDLIKYTEEIDNEDITFVYDNLNRGSRNHLRAFVSNLYDQGVEEEVKALYMEQEAFDAIINSDMERGGNKGGRGKGNGGGNGRRGGRR